MDKLLSSKIWLVASSLLILLGLGVFFWDDSSDVTGTQVNTVSSSAPTKLSAGPLAPKSEVPTPNHLKKVEQTIETVNVILQAGDSLSRILNRLEVDNRQIYQLTQADQDNVLTTLQPQQTMAIKLQQPNHSLQSLTLTINKQVSHRFQLEESGYSHKKLVAPIESITRYKEVEIKRSLFLDGSQAGIEDKLLFQLADIFKWDIDFALDIRSGDRFALLYEEQYINGDKIGTSNIIAAEFINNGRSFEAIRFNTEKRTDYFTRDGLSLRKAFIRTPVDFTRISSHFNPHRLHPIFKTSRPHQGVDYAAPTGTEVNSAGDGVVSFVGQMKGYGNTVIIDHGNGFTTLYAHLNGFVEQLVPGQPIKQDQIIAYVGQTGWATGPHLHYEFRVNGQHKNPETVTIPNDSPMTKSELRAFLPYAQKIMTQLQHSHSAAFTQHLQALRR